MPQVDVKSKSAPSTPQRPSQTRPSVKKSDDEIFAFLNTPAARASTRSTSLTPTPTSTSSSKSSARARGGLGSSAGGAARTVKPAGTRSLANKKGRPNTVSKSASAEDKPLPPSTPATAPTSISPMPNAVAAAAQASTTDAVPQQEVEEIHGLKSDLPSSPARSEAQQQHIQTEALISQKDEPKLLPVMSADTPKEQTEQHCEGESSDKSSRSVEDPPTEPNEQDAIENVAVHTGEFDLPSAASTSATLPLSVNNEAQPREEKEQQSMTEGQEIVREGMTDYSSEREDQENINKHQQEDEESTIPTENLKNRDTEEEATPHQEMDSVKELHQENEHAEYLQTQHNPEVQTPDPSIKVLAEDIIESNEQLQNSKQDAGSELANEAGDEEKEEGELGEERQEDEEGEEGEGEEEWEESVDPMMEEHLQLIEEENARLKMENKLMRSEVRALNDEVTALSQRISQENQVRHNFYNAILTGASQFPQHNHFKPILTFGCQMLEALRDKMHTASMELLEREREIVALRKAEDEFDTVLAKKDAAHAALNVKLQDGKIQSKHTLYLSHSFIHYSDEG